MLPARPLEQETSPLRRGGFLGFWRLGVVGGDEDEFDEPDLRDNRGFRPLLQHEALLPILLNHLGSIATVDVYRLGAVGH